MQSQELPNLHATGCWENAYRRDYSIHTLYFYSFNTLLALATVRSRTLG